MRLGSVPILFHEDYEVLLKVAGSVDWRFEVALVLANETGHRIGAIRELRWSDVEPTGGRIRWRATTDKIGFEHVTLLTEAAIAALDTTRKHQPGIGDAWVFPAPKNDSEPCSRHLMRDWWRRAERVAELRPKKGRGWHSLRRKFATELKDTPLKDLAYLGGWKRPETILQCYQQPDEVTMERALSNRRKVSAGR